MDRSDRIVPNTSSYAGLSSNLSSSSSPGPSSSILATALGTAWLLLAATASQAQEAQDEQSTGGRNELPSLDGSGNNRALPTQGAAGTPYRRLGESAYADGIGQPADGPNARYLSNRIFADRAQNLFSENGVTQWAWT